MSQAQQQGQHEAPQQQEITTAATLMREGPRDFTVIKEVGDGSFGTVCLADWQSPLPSGTMLSPMQHPTTRPEYVGKRLVAIKRMKKPFQNWEECMQLKELKSLLAIPHHPNIIPLYDAFLMPTTRELHFVFECMEGNLYQLTKSRRGRHLAGGLVASIFEQMLQGLHHIHQHGYFHRDMKPENLLITTTGLADYPPSTPFALPNLPNGSGQNQPVERDVLVIVKLADFGLARETASVPPYTEYVSTRWYRAPEVLLRSRDYSNPVDMWALGTILAELVNLRPLFPGQSEVDQVLQIGDLLGDPSPDYGVDERGRIRGGGPWEQGIRLARAVGFTFRKMIPIKFSTLFGPRVPSSLIDCIQDLLRYDPALRPTTQECIDHVYFKRDAPRLKPPKPKPVIPSVGTQPADPKKSSSTAAGTTSAPVATTASTAAAAVPASQQPQAQPVRTTLPPRANLVPLPANVTARPIPPSHSNQSTAPRPPFASEDPQRVMLPSIASKANLVNLQPLSAQAAATLQAQAQAQAQAHAQAQAQLHAQYQRQQQQQQQQQAVAEGSNVPPRMPFYEQPQIVQTQSNVLPKIAIPPVGNVAPGLGSATPKPLGEETASSQGADAPANLAAGENRDASIDQQRYMVQQAAAIRQQQQLLQQNMAQAQRPSQPFAGQQQQYAGQEQAMTGATGMMDGATLAQMDSIRRKSKGWGGAFNIFAGNGTNPAASLTALSAPQAVAGQGSTSMPSLRRPPQGATDVHMAEATTPTGPYPPSAPAAPISTYANSSTIAVNTSAQGSHGGATQTTAATQPGAGSTETKESKKARKEAAMARRQEEKKAYQDRARAVMQKRKQMMASTVVSKGKDEVEWLSSDAPPVPPANYGLGIGAPYMSEIAKGKQPMAPMTSGVPIFGGHPHYAGHPIPQNFGSAAMMGAAGGGPAGMGSYGSSMGWQGRGGSHARHARPHQRMLSMEYDDSLGGPSRQMGSSKYAQAGPGGAMVPAGSSLGGGSSIGVGGSASNSYVEELVAEQQRRMSLQSFQTGDSDPGPAPQQMHGPTTQFLQRSNTATSLNSLAPSFANMAGPPPLQMGIHAGSSAHGSIDGRSVGSSLDHQLIADMGNMTAQDRRIRTRSTSPGAIHFVGSRGSYTGARSRTGSRASSNHRQGSASPLHVQPGPRFHPYSYGGGGGGGGGGSSSTHSGSTSSLYGVTLPSVQDLLGENLSGTGSNPAMNPGGPTGWAGTGEAMDLSGGAGTSAAWKGGPGRGPGPVVNGPNGPMRSPGNPVPLTLPSFAELEAATGANQANVYGGPGSAGFVGGGMNGGGPQAAGAASLGFVMGTGGPVPTQLAQYRRASLTPQPQDMQQ